MLLKAQQMYSSLMFDSPRLITSIYRLSYTASPRRYVNSKDYLEWNNVAVSDLIVFHTKCLMSQTDSFLHFQRTKNTQRENNFIDKMT